MNLKPDFMVAKPGTASTVEAANAKDVGNITIVGGCGHVGLPLGMAFANKGFQVDLLDLSRERVTAVNAGKMPFKEQGADELLPHLIKPGKLSATMDAGVIARANVVIVTI